MKSLSARSAALVSVAALALNAPLHAQGYGGGNTGGASVDGAVRGFLDGAQKLCGRVPDPAYRVDCLADYFDWLADRLPQTGDMAQAREIVRGAARKLNRVARENASRSKPAAVLREGASGSGKRTSRAVIPVEPARQARATASALAIVQETETLLLRAAERSERRKVAFRDIAIAVGSSSRILLRSG